MELVKDLWKLKYPVRSLTVGCTHLVKYSGEAEQIGLFDEKTTEDRGILKNRGMDSAVDIVRKKYGRRSLICASLINGI